MLQEKFITTANKIITTVSPGMLSEVRPFCYVRKEDDYENIT